MYFIIASLVTYLVQAVTMFRYLRSLLWGLAIGLSHWCIGAVLTFVLVYCLETDFQDLHIVLCTFGFHFFCAQAILCLNSANGWSAPLVLGHRRYVHVFLQLCGMAMVCYGTYLITEEKGILKKTHESSGYIATVLGLCNVVIGPGALYGGQYFKTLHVTFGLPSFIMSSVCVCTGMHETSFERWAGKKMTLTLLGFVIIYTLFIVLSCFSKCVSRVKYLM